ncbi:hypothetical protein NVP1127O_75 [Vibrio phage 1.127.O._10N.286.52.E12]|nr:hypothetical protein NVP1127O_75 [Vibrio phage 1.127.O._10N.286.52.E12]
MKVKEYAFFNQVAGVIGVDKAFEELSKVGIDYIVDDTCISGAFTWSSTPQGHGFWSDIECGINPYVN